MFKKFLAGTIIFIVTVTLVNFFLGNFSKSSPSNQNNKNSNKVITSPTPTKPPASNQEDLLKKIKNLFFEANPDIEFGITIYNLKTDAYFGYNDTETQHAASVAKVLTAIYLLRQVEEEKIKLNDRMGTYNVEFNLKQMVNQSNNISWEMIDERLGIREQNDYAHSLGLTSVKFEDNLMSPQDAALLFAKLAKGELLEEPYQRKLFSYMQNTETENLITPTIPQGITFYHKTGLYEGEVHDVAIVDHPDRPFVLSIFTVNKLYPDYEGRAKLIQKVASEVYSYMTR